MFPPQLLHPATVTVSPLARPLTPYDMVQLPYPSSKKSQWYRRRFTGVSIANLKVYFRFTIPCPAPLGTAPPAHADDDNPFLSPAPTAANVRLDLPSSPPSVGAESFASPSPTQSELDEEQGHRANTTLNRRTLQVVAHTHGTPRVGWHSPLRAQHQEQRQVNEAKKLKARDVWSFFKKNENGQHACLFCRCVSSSGIIHQEKAIGSRDTQSSLGVSGDSKDIKDLNILP